MGLGCRFWGGDSASYPYSVSSGTRWRADGRAEAASRPRTLCQRVSLLMHSLTPSLVAHAGPAHGVDFKPPWHHSLCPPHPPRPPCSHWARSWCGLRTRRRSTSTSCTITPPGQIRWAGIDGSGLGMCGGRHPADCCALLSADGAGSTEGGFCMTVSGGARLWAEEAGCSTSPSLYICS